MYVCFLELYVLLYMVLCSDGVAVYVDVVYTLDVFCKTQYCLLRVLGVRMCICQRPWCVVCAE